MSLNSSDKAEFVITVGELDLVLLQECVEDAIGNYQKTYGQSSENLQALKEKIINAKPIKSLIIEEAKETEYYKNIYNKLTNGRDGRDKDWARLWAKAKKRVEEEGG